MVDIDLILNCDVVFGKTYCVHAVGSNFRLNVIALVSSISRFNLKIVYIMFIMYLHLFLSHTGRSCFCVCISVDTIFICIMFNAK